MAMHVKCSQIVPQDIIVTCCLFTIFWDVLDCPPAPARPLWVIVTGAAYEPASPSRAKRTLVKVSSPALIFSNEITVHRVISSLSIKTARPSSVVSDVDPGEAPGAGDKENVNLLITH